MAADSLMGRSSFDQLDEILQEGGGEIEVILDGGIQRGTRFKSFGNGCNSLLWRKDVFIWVSSCRTKGVEKALGNGK